MIKTVLLTLFYLLLFNGLISRFAFLQLHRCKPFVTLLLFNTKFITGIFIWAIYTFYYTDTANNDVHKFYNDALVLKQAVHENPQVFTDLMIGREAANALPYLTQMKNWDRHFDEAPVNENRTVIKLNALLLFVSFKTYFVHILFFCFFSTLGWVWLSNAVLHFTGAKNTILALPALFLPSVLLWTSGVMKEPILILGLGVLLTGLLHFEWKPKPVLSMLCGILLILASKFFVLVCLLPACLAFLLFPKIKSRVFLLLKYSLLTGTFLLLAVNIGKVTPKINPLQMLMNKQKHAISEAAYFKAGSRITIPTLENSLGNVIRVATTGIWNTFFRPYVSEAKNPMMLLSAMENLLVLIMVAVAVFFTDWKSRQNDNLLLMLLLFSVAYFALIGMCTPVLGNLVRYKAPLLPVLFLAFIVKANPKYVPDSCGWLLRS